MASVVTSPKRAHAGLKAWHATAVAAIAVSTMMVAVEAGLRFGLGLGNPVLVTPDPLCRYLLKPNQDVVRFFAHTHINRFGMRSDEVPLPRPPGTLRILFVGDSITYGTSRVDQAAIFTELLHRDLPAVVHRPVEVLNASAGGWAPGNELAYIESRGVFEADIVLLVLNDGDLTQPPATIADAGGELFQNRPHTAIGELYQRFVLPHVAGLARPMSAEPFDQAAAGVTRENLSNLNKMAKLVQAQGAQFVLVYLPFRKDIPGEARGAAAILEDWAVAHNVAMLDLTDAETPYASSEITFDGIHFNSRGHSIVATAIEQLWRSTLNR